MVGNGGQTSPANIKGGETMTVHEFKDTTYAGLRVTRFMVADADGRNIATFENGNSSTQHRIFTTRKGAEKYIAINS